MISMQAVADGLGDLGYRVLMYDLYGRGLSDAPKGLQNRAFFLRQLSDLFAYLRLKDEVTIVGYSMGGGIATAFAAENRHHVKRLMLIASSGVMNNESRFSSFCRRVPAIGDWIHGMFAHRRTANGIPERGQTKEIDQVLRAQRRELKRRGYLPAILSSRRGILAENHEAEHRQLGRQGIPVVAIWAGSDPIIPLRAVGLLALWNRAARQEVVDHADHGLPYTRGAQLIIALRSALRD
jgi:pimeloyl-ACP methyl ester carboxylesterase